jgi:hypothetical protein
MWIAVIAATLMSLIGYQSLLAETNVQNSYDSAEADLAAADMATYRFAVVDFANANTGASTALMTDLRFPLGHTGSTLSKWSNYIAADGTILIYAIAAAPAGLNSAINRLTGDSTMVVETSGSATSTAQPLTTAATNALARRSTIIPNAPVWFAHRG